MVAAFHKPIEALEIRQQWTIRSLVVDRLKSISRALKNPSNKHKAGSPRSSKGKPALFYLPDQIQIVRINKKSEPISYSEDKVRISIFWSEWRESNSRPLEPHSSALPKLRYTRISLRACRSQLHYYTGCDGFCQGFFYIFQPACSSRTTPSSRVTLKVTFSP